MFNFFWTGDDILRQVYLSLCRKFDPAGLCGLKANSGHINRQTYTQVSLFVCTEMMGIPVFQCDFKLLVMSEIYGNFERLTNTLSTHFFSNVQYTIMR